MQPEEDAQPFLQRCELSFLQLQQGRIVWIPQFRREGVLPVLDLIGEERNLFLAASMGGVVRVGSGFPDLASQACVRDQASEEVGRVFLLQQTLGCTDDRLWSTHRLGQLRIYIGVVYGKGERRAETASSVKDVDAPEKGVGMRQSSLALSHTLRWLTQMPAKFQSYPCCKANASPCEDVFVSVELVETLRNIN